MRAISWRGAERHAFLEAHRTAVDVAFSIDQNQFNGETYLELTVCDIRPAQAPMAGPNTLPADVVPSAAECKM
jgi:hypothetical protein